MTPPNDTQKGAFFGILAATLIVVLTVMAMKAVDQQPQPHIGRAHHTHLAQAPAAGAPSPGR